MDGIVPTVYRAKHASVSAAMTCDVKFANARVEDRCRPRLRRIATSSEHYTSWIWRKHDTQGQVQDRRPTKSYSPRSCTQSQVYHPTYEARLREPFHYGVHRERTRVFGLSSPPRSSPSPLTFTIASVGRRGRTEPRARS